MPAPSVGVLLALSGEDADIVRSLNQPGSGMSVVRRCADLPELLSAGLADLASIAVLDTGFEEIDRTVLERLERAGLHGLLLVEADQEARWSSCGWRVERRDAPVARIRAILQEIVRDSFQGCANTPGRLQGDGGLGAASASAADPRAMSAEQQTSWLEEIWRLSGDDAQAQPDALAGASPAGLGFEPGSASGPGLSSATGSEPGPAPRAVPSFVPRAAPGPAPAPPPGSTLPGSTLPSIPPAPGTAIPGTPASASTPGLPTVGPPACVPPNPAMSAGTPDMSAPPPQPQPPQAAQQLQPGEGGLQHRESGDDALAPGRLVVVWGTHGAPGRSTIAACLAHALGRNGGAILVDADVESPCLVQLLGLPDDSSALAGAARLATYGRLDAETFARFLTPVCQQVHLLGGLGRSGRWRELPPASMKEVWAQCRRAAAWTVVDVAGGAIDEGIDDFTLEPGRSAVAYDLVRHADVVVVVGGGDPVGIRRLLQLLADLDTEAPLNGRLQVVVNRVRASVAGPAPTQAVREALGRFGGVNDPVLLPDDAATADRCLLHGRSVLDGAPTSPLGKALVGLAARIDPTAAQSDASRGGRRRWWAGWARTNKRPGPRRRRRSKARSGRHRSAG